MILPKRFWTKIKNGLPNECWEWQSWRNPDGYGRFHLDGHAVAAHRLALAATGVNVTGLVVRHHCDNPACCNPQHLAVGSHADNIRERDARGRGRWIGRKGELNARAKLKESQVRELRAKYLELRRYPSGRLRNGELGRLAQDFELPVGTVRNIVEGYQWKHLAES